MSLDDDKKREEIAKLKVERLKTLTGLCVSVCSALGIVGVFAYCFFIAGFVPAGLSMGDTLFFVFAMLAFTFTGVVLALLGMLPFVPYVMQSRAAGSWPLTKFVRGDNAIWALAPVVGLAVIASFKLLASVKSVNTDYVFSVEWAIAAFILLGVYLAIVQLLMDDWVGALGYSVPGLIFILFSSVAAGLATSAGSGVGAVRALASLGIILLAGVTFAVAFSMLGASGTTSPAPAAKYKSVLALILFGSFLPYLAAATSLGSFNFVMQGLGLREESATLIVNAANLATIQGATDAKGTILYSCRIDKDSYAVSNVRVLWHGMGQRSYIELASPSKSGGAEKDYVRVELDSAGVKKSKSVSAGSCVELRRGIYFASGSKVLDRKEWQVVAPFVSDFFAIPDAKDSKIIAVGYADPMPRAEGNYSLAQARACDVIKHVLAATSIGLDRARIDVRLENQDTAACNDIKDKAAQRACFETSRRVEVQLVKSPRKLVRVGTAEASTACKLSKKDIAEEAALQNEAS